MKVAIFQKGFAAIAAIFLVVVLSTMGAFLVSLSNTQQVTSAQDVMGSKAYWAARAGLEWGIFYVTKNSACSAASTTLTVDIFQVVVNCSRTAYLTEGTNITQIRAVAATGTVGSAGYVERSLSASLEN